MQRRESPKAEGHVIRRAALQWGDAMAFLGPVSVLVSSKK